MGASRNHFRAIYDCADQAPWHPLEPVSLARLEPREGESGWNVSSGTVRPTFLAKLTLKRLREADLGLYGRDTLAEYAVWAAKIMNDELRLSTEALQAIEFAIERTPIDKQQPLIEFRVKIGK